MVASLSVPWGNSSDDIGGYHLVWPRDLVESAGALLALGALDEAADILRYLVATQQADGNWSQNQWLGGKAYWLGSQLDETAFPVLLAASLAERNALGGIDIHDMVRRALGFIARHGPATDQDRWEEDVGINAFTLATCVSALVCGASFLDEPARAFALQLADYWNARIEDWTSVHGNATRPLAGSRRLLHSRRAAAVPAGRQRAEANSSDQESRVRPRICPRKSRSRPTSCNWSGWDCATRAMCWWRTASRSSTTNCESETPNGPAWHRYTGDGYGEHADGSPVQRRRVRPGLAAADRRARALRDAGRPRSAAHVWRPWRR